MEVAEETIGKARNQIIELSRFEGSGEDICISVWQDWMRVDFNVSFHTCKETMEFKHTEVLYNQIEHLSRNRIETVLNNVTITDGHYKTVKIDNLGDVFNSFYKPIIQ